MGVGFKKSDSVERVGSKIGRGHWWEQDLYGGEGGVARRQERSAEHVLVFTCFSWWSSDSAIRVLVTTSRHAYLLWCGFCRDETGNFYFILRFFIRWEKAKKAREDKAKEEKEQKMTEAKSKAAPSLGDSMWGASVEKEEEVSQRKTRNYFYWRYTTALKSL